VIWILPTKSTKAERQHLNYLNLHPLIPKSQNSNKKPIFNEWKSVVVNLIITLNFPNLKPQYTQGQVSTYQDVWIDDSTSIQTHGHLMKNTEPGQRLTCEKDLSIKNISSHRKKYYMTSRTSKKFQSL